MNLTDTEKENLLRSFYRERLLPLAAIADKRGVEFFPSAPDEAATSYYVERGEDENYVHEINSADIAAELKKMWRDNELSELVELAEPLVSLAENLQTTEESSDEVSPFIYAMF